jgi:fibronectin type 3 domain-containing protein
MKKMSRLIFVTALSAPKNVNAMANESPGSIHISWNAVAQADGYNLYRASEAKPDKYVRFGSTSWHGYSDVRPALSPDEKYRYKVVAYNATEYSKLSAKTAWVEPEGSPDILPAPRNVSATVAGSAITLRWDAGRLRIVLTWDAVPSATKYEVLRSVDEENYDVIGDNIAAYYNDDSSASEASIQQGGAYYYRVRAYNGALQGYISETYGPVISVPAAPALTVTVDALNVTLRWDVVPFADGYYVARSTDGAHYTRLTPRAIAATTYPDTPPAAGTYRYRVNANNSEGASADAVVEATVPAVLPPIPAAPQNL